MEVPEFEVYLDIDGAVEEDEDTVQSGNGAHCPVPLDTGEQSIQLPWQPPVNGLESGNTTRNLKSSGIQGSASAPSTSGALSTSGASAPSTSGASAPSSSGRSTHRRGHDSVSDNEEVDVDTPYDGKLLGQTQIKSVPINQQQTLLSTLLSYTTMSSSCTDAPKKSDVPKKIAVAKKSTTPKKSGSTFSAKKSTSQHSFHNIPLVSSDPPQEVRRVVLNVAKKSTSKQSKPSASSLSAKNNPGRAKTGKCLQVKFGPRKYLGKESSHAKFSSLSRVLMKPPAKKVAQKTPKSFAFRSLNQAVPSSFTSQVGKKMFPCHERSGDRIACPECGVVVKTYCLRSHLKTVHNLPMKNCTKCKITFTDLNLYSEHYASHLQEEEDHLTEINSSPRLNASRAWDSQFEGSREPVVAKKQPSSTVTRESSEEKILSEDQSVSDETEFPLQATPLHTPPSVKKRKLSSSSVSVGPFSKQCKFTNENQTVTDKIAFPFHPKLPPKHRKQGFHPKKKWSSFFTKNKGLSVEHSASCQAEISTNVMFPAKPKLPCKPRKPFSSSKMRQLSSVSRDNKYIYPENIMSDDPRERRNSTASVQSDEMSAYGTSELSRPASPLYKENWKMANRRQVSESSLQDLPPPKKLRFDVDAAAPVTKKYCGKATVSLVSLETASRPYDCKKCLAAFHVALQCPRSFRLHSQTKPYACSSCPVAFALPGQLKAHQDGQCCAGPFKHEDDEDAAAFHTSLRRHRIPGSPHSQELAQNIQAKSYGKGQLFECDKCKETFQYRSLLLRHIPYHSYQYSCGICKKAFVQKVDLLDHLQIMHDGRMLLRCKYCEQKYDDMSVFDDHILTHKDGTVVPCTVCSQVFSSSRQMQIHMTVSHGVSQNVMACQVCGKRFKQARLLSIHMRVAHKNAKTVTDCNICGRMFKQAKHLSVHMKVAHKTSTPIVTKFLSCRFCHKVFHNRQGLASHYKLRHGVSLSVAVSTESMKNVKNVSDLPTKPSVSSSQPKPKCPSTAVKVETSNSGEEMSRTCHLCKKTYSERKVLVSHYQRFHRMEPPGVKLKETSISGELITRTCHLCNKTYSKRKVLVSHYRRFHGLEPPGVKSMNSMKCQICGKVVFSLQGLKVHYKIRHRRKIPEEVRAAHGVEPKPLESEPVPVACEPKAIAASKGRCRCGICGKFFLYTWSLFRHQRLYHKNSIKGILKPKPKPIQNTNSHVYVKTSLKANSLSFQKRKPWSCSVCEKSFVLRKTMRMHVKSEHPKDFDDQRFGGRKCLKCRKTFGSRTKLSMHMKTCGLKQRAQKQPVCNTNSDKRIGEFKCTMCEKVFSWRQNLIRHMQADHKLSKDVILYNMTHQKLAQAEKSYPSELKFYLCEICKVCFTARQPLARHQRRRHGGKSSGFQCRRRACKKHFTKNDALLHHIKIAHPEMSVYWCQGCNSGFETSGELYSHRCFLAKQPGTLPSNLRLYWGEDDTMEGSFTSLSAEQVCRYRCMICDMGFHIAREWTKHMQEHTENVGEIPETSTHHEQVMEATDKVRLSIFDVLSADSIFSCKFCKVIFSDENEMNLHICEQPVATNTGTKKTKKKRKSRNLEPVKCTVCLKFFSPLSIKRHMMNIHSLPMRICTKCNVVFTDLERYRRHNEYHHQHEGSVTEGAVAVSNEDELNEESVTFFICQVCGGLFSDTDSLESHACSGGNNEEMAGIQYESEAVGNVDALESHHTHSQSSEYETVSHYSKQGCQSSANDDMYSHLNPESEGLVESQTMDTSCGDAFDDGFHTRIVIESVRGGATAESDTENERGIATVESDTNVYGKESTLSNTDTGMDVGNENACKQSVSSCRVSSEEVLLNSSPETLLVAPDSSELKTYCVDVEENAPRPQEQAQSDTDQTVSARVPFSHDPPPEPVVRSAESVDISETSQSNQPVEASTEIHRIFQYQETHTESETSPTMQSAEADIGTCGSTPYKERESESTLSEAGEAVTNQKAHCEEASVVPGDALPTNCASTGENSSGMIAREGRAELRPCGQPQGHQEQGKIAQERQGELGPYSQLESHLEQGMIAKESRAEIGLYSHPQGHPEQNMIANQGHAELGPYTQTQGHQEQGMIAKEGHAELAPYQCGQPQGYWEQGMKAKQGQAEFGPYSQPQSHLEQGMKAKEGQAEFRPYSQPQGPYGQPQGYQEQGMIAKEGRADFRPYGQPQGPYGQPQGHQEQGMIAKEGQAEFRPYNQPQGPYGQPQCHQEQGMIAKEGQAEFESYSQSQGLYSPPQGHQEQGMKAKEGQAELRPNSQPQGPYGQPHGQQEQSMIAKEGQVELAPFGQPQGLYGQPQSHQEPGVIAKEGQVEPGPFGQPQGPYGQPQSHQEQGMISKEGQAGFGPYGQRQGLYGQPRGPYGQPQGHLEQRMIAEEGQADFGPYSQPQGYLEQQGIQGAYVQGIYEKQTGF
ncbi:uncharacterized protein LOC143292818 [Babylonia areolata]|uniref:uncharacterized protein LOC143292818 n=1 Tax=Babylonia areolata TaxID=304850 RepID=UPI003FD222A0